MGIRIPCFVINLEGSKKRWQSVSRKLHSEGIHFERFGAVDGKRVDRSSPAIAGWCSHFCTDAMVGCALSHIRLWNKIVREGYPLALVLEDDVTLAPNFARNLASALECIPEDFDVLFLGCIGPACSPRLTSKKLPEGIIVPLWNLGTHAYVLSQKGAQKLASSKAAYHIDQQMSAKTDLVRYAIDPPIALPGDMRDSSVSSIEFPRTLNFVLNSFENSRGQTLAYVPNLPILQIPFANIPVTFWTIVFFLLGLTDRIPHAYIAALIVGEFVAFERAKVSKSLVGCALAFACGIGARRVVSKICLSTA